MLLASWYTDIIQEISHLKITRWLHFFPTTSLNQLQYSWAACRLEIKKWYIYIYFYIYTHTQTK